MGNFSCHVLVLIVFLFIETPQFCRCQELSSYDCIELERQILLKFKQSLEDPSNRLLSWTGKDCCKWQGVECNNITKHVIKLDLRNPVSYVSTQLEADEINPCLLELKYLTYLDLSSNNFKGSPIPNFIGSLELLRYLNLSAAHLSGMVSHHLGNLSHLRVLDLHHDSELIVDNLQWVSRLSSLERLDMSLVKIQKGDDLMQLLNMLPSLLELRLSGCGLEANLFQGSVNSTSLSALEYLDLSENSLFGSIPDALQNMTSLRVLNLSVNTFDSTIPHWIGQLKNLKRLDLSINSFHGLIPSSLGRLSGLIELDLSFNSFNSTIPLWLIHIKGLLHLYLSGNGFNHIEGGITRTLWHLCNLKTLDLSSNKLQGEMLEPSEKNSQCVRYGLETLRLASNSFSGGLPHWLGQFKNLKHLDLSSNSFSGMIPASIGRLSGLRELDLSDNQLNGTIPDSLGQLSDLKSLRVYSNSLGGIVSEVHFANLSSLEMLDTSFNSLVFKMRSDWVPPFQLRYIYIRSCKIGSQFPGWLRTQTKIIDLELSNTSISGTVPFWLGDLHVFHLYLSNNKLSGPLRNLPSGLIAADISNNLISGSLRRNLPSNLTAVDLSNNLISGSLPQNIGDMMPTLKSLVLHGNLLNGSIPTSLCKIRTLQTLDLSKNRLFGNIPHCWQDLQELIVIDLSSNNLSGVIPSSIGHLSRLQSLHLNNNNLSGELPPTLKNCSNLVVLDLGENGFFGNLPMWIGESMLLLEILRLRSNLFYGSISSQLCLLSELQILDLASNNISGSIPHCFCNLSGMISGQTTSQISSYLTSYYTSLYGDRLSEVIKGSVLEYTKTLKLVINMDLSSNNLVGTIPEELMILSGLMGLNLSENHLSGHIPKDIGNLNSLESLDFSRNQLSGTIPWSMSSLTFLSHLNLSYNKLSGQIPSGNQLQTLNDPSIYIGNRDLCGALLPKKCVGDEPPQASATNDNEEKDEGIESETVWFYSVIVLGYSTGLCGVLGVLIFKKNWRYAYFRFVDTTKDWFSWQ